MGEMPVAASVAGLVEDKAEGLLPVDSRGEGERFVQRVAQTGVDVPPSRGVVVGGHPIDGEDEVIGSRLVVGAVDAVDTTNVALNRVAERPQQQPERSVEVVAV